MALHGKPFSELWDVTCHMESYSVTCHRGVGKGGQGGHAPPPGNFHAENFLGVFG